MYRNIWKLYLANLLTGVIFWYAISWLFMLQIGMNAFEIGLNGVVYLIVTLLFDVPAGVLADKWKRKYTLLLALVFLCASSIISGTSHSLTQYLVGTVIYGGYSVLSSGTFQAIMYDSLLEVGHQKEYAKHQGRAYALFLLGVSLSSLAGGYIGHYYGYGATYLLSVLPSVGALIAIAFVKEPLRHKPIASTRWYSHITASSRTLVGSRLLLHLSLFIMVAEALRSSQNEFAGLYYVALGLTAIPIGYVNAGKWLSGSIGQLIAPRIGQKVLHLIPVLFASFAIFSMWRSRWSIVFFLLAVVLQSAMNNQAEAEVQDHTPSSVRATTLSTLSFAGNIILVPIGLGFGYLAQHYDAFIAYRLIALVGLLYTVVWFISGRFHISAILHGDQKLDPVLVTEKEII
jgi:MFS family permease